MGSLLLLPVSSTVSSTAAVRTGELGNRSISVPEERLCRSTVSALLGNELLQVAAGRPDAGSSTTNLIISSYRHNPTLLQRVQRVEQQLLSTAAADLLSRYRMDVASELTGYAGRIAEACARA